MCRVYKRIMQMLSIGRATNSIEKKCVFGRDAVVGAPTKEDVLWNYRVTTAVMSLAWNMLQQPAYSLNVIPFDH